MKKQIINLMVVAAATMLNINANAQAPVAWTANPNLYAYTAYSWSQQTVTKIVTASDGSIITAGNYSDVATSVFFKVHKYDAVGSLVAEYDDVDAGSTTVNGTYTVFGYTVCDMVIDAFDNVFLIGYQNDTVTIGGTVYKGKRCLIKLDANLNLQWKNISDGNNWLSMCLDGNGNVIVNGTTKNTNDGTGANIVTAKYDSNGNSLWTNTYSSIGNFADNGNDVAVDSKGDVYVTGSCMTASSGSASVTIKYKNDGTFLWDNLYNYNASAAVNDVGASIAVGANGNSYVLANCNTGLGQQFPCVMKIDVNGNLQWSHLLQKTILQYKSYNSVKIRIDAKENVYAGTYLQTYFKGATSYIYKFKTSGKEKWEINTDSITLADFDVSPQGDVYLTGAALPYGHFGGNGRVQAARYDSTGTLVWNDWYEDKFVPNQTLDSRSLARCLSINPNNPDEVTIGGGASGKDNLTGFFNSAGIVRNYKVTARLAQSISKNETNFNCYPNPSDLKAQLVFTLNESAKVSIQLFDVSGRLIKTICNDQNSNGQQIIDVNTSDFHSGIYFCKLQSKSETGNSQQVLKLVVKH